MKFISLVCNIFLCSVLLCTISIFSAKAVQDIFFAFAQPPPSKIKWFVRSRDKTVLFESHSFRFAFSIISYHHSARNVFVQFYNNSLAETVCTPFWNLIVIGRISLDFLAKTLTKNLYFVTRMPTNYCKRILQAWIVSCLSIPVLDALYKPPQIEFGKYHFMEEKKNRIGHWSGHLFWFLRA